MTYDDLLLFYARKGWGRPLRQSAYRKFSRRNRDKAFVTITQSGFSIKTIIGDTVDNSLFVHGFFESGTTRIIDQIGDKCDGFIDVGCNIGYFSCLFGYKHPDKPIVSIDPNPAMIERTRENLELNHIENYELMPYGIGARREKLKLNISRLRHSLSSFAYVPKTGLDEQIEVDVVPLSDILDGIDLEDALLKIDAEGFEYNVFQGITKEAGVKIRYIVFELSLPNILRSGISPDAFLSLPVFRWFDFFRIDEENGDLSKADMHSLLSNPETNLNILLVRKSDT